MSAPSTVKYAIVCVDDEKIILDSLQEQLESQFGTDIHCEIAESAEEAWEVIEGLVTEGYKIGLVISDWLMPKVRGDEFLSELHKAHPSTVTILLSGQADADSVENARDNANLFAYIKKPWRSEDLFRRIEAGLGQQANA
jgi:DNA-binding NtrC family response regulator